MKNFNVNMETLKNIKAVIFDFDETLYSSPNSLECYIKYIKQTILSLSNYSEQQALEIMDKFGFTQKGENRVSFGKTCENFGIKRSAWDEYKKEHFFEIDYENASIVDNEILKTLSKRFKLFIVSNELKENIEYKSKKLNIDLSVFDKIYAPEKNSNVQIIKMEAYKTILRECNITEKEAIVIGDRYQVDIKPFEDIGGGGIQIANTDEVNQFLKQLLENVN